MHIFFLLKPKIYLDPGTGSFIIQMLLAGLLGGAVAVRIYWKKIVAWFRRKKPGEVEDADPTEIPDELDEI
ncbi:MAG: hypothetical protein ABIG43_01395 [Chloroflexota bacterium]